MANLINLSIDGIPEVEERLRGMDARATDMTPAMEQIELVMLRSAQENFVAQGRPDAWQPLSTSTIKRRRNQNKSTIQILRDTGYLMQSLSPQGGQYALREIGPLTAMIGTNRPGASAHQTGSGNVPARPFLVHQPEDIEDYKQIILDHVTGFGEE